MYYIGVMSGTSCDGIDVVVVDFVTDKSAKTKIIAAQTTPYPAAIRRQLLDVMADKPTPISSISQLDAQLGSLFAKSINQLLQQHAISISDIQAIGLHGQTIHHRPPQNNSDNIGEIANTIQLGSATITAQQTGITTVANFRQMDVACGGQGAPLAPILHQSLFSQKNKTVAVLNLGGIANITILKDGTVMGFDTGPASCLMDEYIQSQQNKPFDESGQWAEQGQINGALLQYLLSDEYFNKPFPKSTGREYFNLDWLKQYLTNQKGNAVDVQRTLLQLTVESIALGLKQTQVDIDQLVICGGGVHNTFLMQQLNQRINCDVLSSADCGFDPDYVEAVLMAWLAQQNIKQNSLDLAQITGCKVAHVYGVQFKSN